MDMYGLRDKEARTELWSGMRYLSSVARGPLDPSHSDTTGWEVSFPEGVVMN